MKDVNNSNSFSRKALESIPPLIRGKEAIYRETFTVARVQIANATVLNDVLEIAVTPIATPGLNAHRGTDRLSAHGRLLFASSRYLVASYAGWQLYLDEAVVAKTIKIVSTLGMGSTYQSDYINTPVTKNPRFKSLNTPGPVARSLFDFLRHQQAIELSEIPNLLSSVRED